MDEGGGGEAEGRRWQDQSGKVCERGRGKKPLSYNLNEGWTESKLCKGEEIEHEWRICEGRQVGGGSCTYSNSAPL